MSGPAVCVDKLVNRFGAQVVHDGIGFEVERGEVFAIVGGSGSGKTVLLHTLLGLHRPNEGSVRVLGHDVCDADDELPYGRVGVLFQDGALWSELTVLENVMFPMLQHSDATAQTCRELAALKLRMAGLDASAFGKYPAALSGGMRKRAGIARALATDPELLFLDEPTSGLDPISATEFDELIEYLHPSLDLTVVMITHDLASLFRTVQRVAVLVDGDVVTGTLEEVAAAEHPWVRRYFGGPRARAAGSVDHS